MKNEIWYCPKFNCIGVLTIMADGETFFELETRSGPIVSDLFLRESKYDHWILIGDL